MRHCRQMSPSVSTDREREMPHLPHRAAGSMTAEKPAQFFLRRPFGSAQLGKHVQDAGAVHLPPRGVAISARVQFRSNAIRGRDACRFDSVHRCGKPLRTFVSIALRRLDAERVPIPAQMRSAVRASELHARAFAACRASFVRVEIAFRSFSATRAMIPTVKALASGMSTAVKATPAFRRPIRNARHGSADRLRDQQRRARQPSMFHSLRQFRAIVALAGFNLDER